MKLRQVIYSYGLILVLVSIFLGGLVLPLINSWQVLNQKTQALRTTLLESENLEQSHARRVSVAQLKIATSIKRGIVRYTKSSVEAGHLMQIQIKELMQQHSARIKQLKPVTRTIAQGLLQSQLELSFVIPNQNIQSFLLSLSAARPMFVVELLSLRSLTEQYNSAPLASSAVQNKEKYEFSAREEHLLEARLIVQQLAVDDSVMRVDDSLLPVDDSPLLAVDDSPTDAKGSEIVTSSSRFSAAEGLVQPLPNAPNTIAGVFDRSVRARFNDPNLAAYRVAAISSIEGKQRAVVVHEATGARIRVRKGDYVDAWRVDAITDSFITLSLDQQQGELRLKMRP